MSWYDVALANYYRSKMANSQAISDAIANIGNNVSGAITQGRYNSLADQLGSQAANSGAYAPRASLVSPGTNPNSPNTMNYIPRGTPTAGTPPARLTGGLAGMQIRNQMASQGIEAALKRAQIAHYGAASEAALSNAEANRGYKNYLEGEGSKGNVAAQRQAQADAEKNADTVPRVYGELKDIYGQQGATQWLQAAQNGSLTRGRVENRKWVNDQNGPVVSASDTLTKPPQMEGGFLGMGQSPHQFTEDDAQPYAPIDAVMPFAQRLAKIKAAGGRYVPPVATPGSIQGNQPNMPTFATPEAAKASGLPSGTPFRDPNGMIRYMP